MSAFEIVALDKHHERGGFSCGEATLDQYLRQYIGQDVKKQMATAYVLLREGEGEVLGYYTLSAHSLEMTALPEAMSRRLPRYPQVPAVLMGRLALDQRVRGQGLGRVLLADARTRIENSGVAARFLVVDALHEAAKAFYLHYDFIPLERAPMRLILPLG